MTEQLFSLVNLSALLSWIALIILPRWSLVLVVLRFVVIGLLSLIYSVFIFVYFFQFEGVGFFSIQQVQTMFLSPEIALAGWVHFLAFDLFVGIWIAKRSDHIGISRLVQAPILIVAFMFGPAGLLLFYAAQFPAQFSHCHTALSSPEGITT